MGISLRTSNSRPDVSISKFWNQFYKKNIFEKIPNKCSSDIMGLYVDYEGDHNQPYTLVIGCQVSDVEAIPKGMVVKKIPAASYAIYTAKGEFPYSLYETWGEIWKSGLPRSYSGDFEVYGKRFENGEIDVYVALNLAPIGR